MTPEPDPIATPAPTAPQAPAGGKQSRRGRHWRRRLAITLLLAVALTCILTRSALVRWVVEPRLSAMFGGKVTMASAALTFGGELSLRGVRVVAPGAPQPAATVLEAQRIDVRLSLRSLLSGSPRIRRIAMDAPIVRISQSKADGSITLQGLTPHVSAGAGGGALPSLSILRGVIELGEHDAGEYSKLIRLPVSGDVTPSDKESGVYLVRFQGLPDEQRTVDFNAAPGFAHPAPTILEGQVNVKTLAARLRLTNVDFASWGTQWAPSAVRDRWTALDLEGRLAQAEFTFTKEAGGAAEVTLEGVGLTLPVAPTEAGQEQPDAGVVGPPPHNLRMTDVRGTVRFDRAALRAALTGLIEDLKYRVILTTDGLAISAPFRMEVETAEPFAVGAHPNLLPFAPPIVRERFRTFSGPTAIVEGQVTVSRGPPSADGVVPEPTIAGGLRFHDGVARYDRFPYPISNLGGLVRFTDKEIRIESITGSNPSGARLHAEGTIIPPTDGSAVDLHIAVVDMPLDDELEAAMPESRKGFIQAMFDSEAYQKRVADGLLQSSTGKADADKALADARTRLAVAQSKGETAPELELEIAGLEKRVLIPVFDLGSRAQLDIHVLRQLGHGDGHWSSEVRASLPRAGLMCRQFAYPCEVRGGLVHFTDELAHVEFTDAVGPTGGTWAITGEVELMNEKGDKILRPHILATARDTPVDALLLEALPSGGTTDPAGTKESPGASPLSAREALRDLRLSGMVDLDVKVDPVPGGDDARPNLGFNAKVALRDIAAAPEGSGATPILSGVRGEAVATERDVRAEGLTGSLAGGSLTASVHASFGAAAEGGATRPTINAEAHVVGLDLASPLDALAGVFDPEVGAKLKAIRADHDPQGRADVTLHMPPTTAGPAPATGGAPFEVAVENARDISFILEGGRVGAATASGRATMGPSAIRFDSLEAPLTFDAQPLADVSLSGEIATSGAAREMRASLRGLRLEAPVVRRLGKSGLGGEPGAADAPLGGFSLESLRGVVDADLVCRTNAGEPPHLTGSILPREVSIERNGVTLAFDQARGLIAFDGPRGSVDGLRLSGNGLVVQADGRWATSPALSLDLAMHGEAASLDDRARALLPREALDAASTIELSVHGPIRLDDGVVRVQPGAAGESEATVSGVVRFTDASAHFGVVASHASGAMSFHAETNPSAPGGDSPGGRFDVSLSIDSALLSGLAITDALARVRTGDQPGEIIVPAAECTAHGGRLVASARVADDDQGNKEFTLDLVAGGIALGAAIQDFRRAEGAEIPPGDPPNRGEVDASLSMRGTIGDESSREGRGSFAVSGGQLAEMPGMMRLIEVSNLNLPLGAELRETFATFHVRGPVATFDTLQIASGSITLLGEGAVRVPELDLDLRFTSRGSFRLPILSDLFEGLRDEIVTVTVSGPVEDPVFGTTTFAGTRAMMGDIFRPDPGRRSAPTPVAPDARSRDDDR